MKKTLGTLAVIGMTTGLLAACGGNNDNGGNASPASPSASGGASASSSAPASEKPKEKVTLTYMASQDWIKESEMQLAKKFEEQTGIHIDYQIVPADQYQNLLKVKLNTKEAPDIFGGQDGKFDLGPLYDVEKNAVDLTNEEWVKRENKLFLEQATWNDKVYALTIWDPTYDYYVVYNKDIFSKLNLQVPKTYAEFLAVCEAIKNAGITPIYEPVSDGWHHVLWFPEIGPKFEEANPGLVDKLNNNEIKLADVPIMEQALTQFGELVKKGFMGDSYFSNTFADTEKNMASGKFAMTLHNLGLPATIEAAFPETKATSFGYFPIPLADNQIMNIAPAAPSKFIYSGSSHIEEAKQYFAFLTQQENLQYFLDNEPRFLALNFEGIEGRFTEEQQKFFDTYGAKQGSGLQMTAKYVNPQWMDIGKDMSAMISGGMDAKKVLESADKRRADQAQAAKDPAWP
ncbi:ABC transporter substrate-binding protein [Cohnella thailandensis]|uniref:Carbohydrate ABC transporter substrate-binding protein n=1 Tax=Cohnella thailandensis TaxID=557557 RepID=A0A841SZ97_9BACL|nr:ABC transporter substrate-binding protein [Cohnella thailandensis]MBB6634957.1 carbohydrate ABC transporter substrate-binding protein [Cohnella thailandensis]MBP1975821.1 raffinose/stachyose/melibiose transport system substrate-binding protein [Cohnella thailandensis]